MLAGAGRYLCPEVGIAAVSSTVRSPAVFPHSNSLPRLSVSSWSHSRHGSTAQQCRCHEDADYPYNQEDYIHMVTWKIVLVDG